MLQKELTIINDLGLHARPAAGIAKIALTAKSPVWLVRDDEKVDATSIIDILTLACEKGTRITLIAEDPGDIHVLNEISTLIESGFGE